MRRLPILFLTTILFLAACGTFEVTYLDSEELAAESLATATLASDSPEPGPVPLGLYSTSDEIRRRIFESSLHWRTIFVDAQTTEDGAPPRRAQAWVDQPALSLRTINGPADGKAETFRVADGMSLLDMNLQTGESNLSPFLDGMASLPYTPAAPSRYPTDTIQPHPLSAAAARPLDVMLFPSAIAQNEGTFKPIGMEVIGYKLTLIVEWTYIQNALPSYRAWVDVSTGVFLRYQRFEKSGGTEILSETTVTRVDYDLPFPSSIFSMVVESVPDFAGDPLAAATATSTPAAPSERDPLGWVYAFVADNASPVRATRLVKVPASCVVGAAGCPEVKVIEPPVPLVYSLAPLVWSPSQSAAAFAYPSNADTNVWGLYFFDAQSGTWKTMVEFNRAIDPPMWSRSGAWIAFRVEGDGQEGIFAMRADGSGLKELSAADALPADGRPYVMDAWLGENALLRSSKGAMYLMRVDDGFVKPLFEAAPGKSAFAPSPDGTLLAYVDDDANSQKQLVKIITPDGKALRDLATFVSGSVMGLTWSPDGKQIGFVLMTDGASSVYVIESDGRNLRQVYMSETDAHFLFSPDGDYLLVQAVDGTGEHLYAIHLDTFKPTLAQAPGIALNESWMWPTWVK